MHTEGHNKLYIEVGVQKFISRISEGFAARNTEVIGDGWCWANAAAASLARCREASCSVSSTIFVVEEVVDCVASLCAPKRLLRSQPLKRKKGDQLATPNSHADHSPFLSESNSPIVLCAVGLWRCKGAREIRILPHCLWGTHRRSWQRLGSTAHHIPLVANHLLGNLALLRCCTVGGQVCLTVRLLKVSNGESTSEGSVQVDHLMRHTNYGRSASSPFALESVVDAQGLFLTRSQSGLVCKERRGMRVY